MKFLLKIVQGPNAGAEIALVEGVRVTLGSADACDIVLADPTLPAEACSIEASADGVVLTPSGAEPERLEPLRVRAFGSTALAVGPADAPWGPLNWESPTRGEAAKEAGETADASTPPPTEEKPAAQDSTKSSGPEKAGSKDGSAAPSQGRRGLRPVFLILLLLILLLAVLFGLRWGYRRFADKAGREMLDMAFEDERREGEVEKLAQQYGLTLVETNGTTLICGDFATRAERLAATAAFYEAQPGLALDLADRETLLSSSSALLDAATEGSLSVSDVTNRVAVLAGRVANPAALRTVLDALRADVPRLAGTDTSAVTLDTPVAAAAPAETSGPSPAAHRPASAAPSPAAPALPLCGILLQPYPCLVLQNGQRLAVGAEVGGYKIERIARDRITLRRGEEEPLEWTP